MSDLDPNRLMLGCCYHSCEGPATEAGLFCETHYPAVFDAVTADARFMIERLRLEQRWAQRLYFIPHPPDGIKIGFTKNIKSRFGDHRRDGLDTDRAVVCRGSREVEAEIFDILKPLATEVPEVYLDDPRIWTWAQIIHDAAPSLWGMEFAINTGRYQLFPAPT